jgi:hypothetical protein
MPYLASVPVSDVLRQRMVKYVAFITSFKRTILNKIKIMQRLENKSKVVQKVTAKMCFITFYLNPGLQSTGMDTGHQKSIFPGNISFIAGVRQQVGCCYFYLTLFFSVILYFPFFVPLPLSQQEDADFQFRTRRTVN